MKTQCGAPQRPTGDGAFLPASSARADLRSLIVRPPDQDGCTRYRLQYDRQAPLMSAVSQK
jgi:hypothetical protein